MLHLKGICKSYGAVRALRWNPSDTVHINVGEVWAFVGENGAGKSTLAAVLAGVITFDTGSITIGGEDYTPKSISDARRAGIEIVFQEPALVPSLTVAENLFLGREREFSRFGFRRNREMVRQARTLLVDVCPHVDPHSIARDLSLEDQKLVEPCRAVSHNPRCIIFDETTAAMSSTNTRLLLELITRLKPTVAVIMVTHRTEEIFSATDKLLVLKDAQYVTVLDTGSTTPEELSSLMVGRDVDLHIRTPQSEDSAAEILLAVEQLTMPDGVEDFSMRVPRGAIVGIGGLAGAGHERILPSLFGIERSASGRVLLRGKPYTDRSPRASIRNGVLYAPKNRDREGLILTQRIRGNAVMSILDRLSRFGMANRAREVKIASELARRLHIKARSVEVICRALSGGNRQKVVLAKLLAVEGDIYLLDNPTRGIDIGARAEIYQLLNEISARGAAIVIVSDELQELLQMCDRIMLVRNGKVSRTFDR